MYKNEVLIAVDKDLEQEVQALDKILEKVPHSRKFKGNCYYFTLDVSNEELESIKEFTETVDETQICIVKIGQHLTDIEIIGSPFDYGIDVKRVVTY